MLSSEANKAIYKELPVHDLYLGLWILSVISWIVQLNHCFIGHFAWKSCLVVTQLSFCSQWRLSLSCSMKSWLFAVSRGVWRPGYSVCACVAGCKVDGWQVFHADVVSSGRVSKSDFCCTQNSLTYRHDWLADNTVLCGGHSVLLAIHCYHNGLSPWIYWL